MRKIWKRKFWFRKKKFRLRDWYRNWTSVLVPDIKTEFWSHTTLPPSILFVHVFIEWPLSCSMEPISTSQFLAEVFFQGVEWWQTDKQIDRVPLWFHNKRIQPNSGPSKSVKVSNHRNYASNFETTSTPSCPPLLNSSSLQYAWQIKNVKYFRLLNKQAGWNKRAGGQKFFI